MIVLALDCATSACSAALLKDDVIVAQLFEPMSRGQSERLVPMIAEVMGELDFSDLDAIAVTNGPGAFTGIRIGLATAKALGLASGKDVTAITTFRAVAAMIPKAERAALNVVIMDSRRAELWVQEFNADLNILTEPLALTAEEIKARYTDSVVLAGDGVNFVDLPHSCICQTALAPHATFVARLAADDLAQGRINPPDPLYLRAPDVTL